MSGMVFLQGSHRAECSAIAIVSRHYVFTVLRLFPALSNAMAMACLIAFSFVGGWLVPIDPSFFQSSTSVLILRLTIDWLDPFLSGMIFLLFANQTNALSISRGATNGRARRTAFAGFPGGLREKSGGLPELAIGGQIDTALSRAGTLVRHGFQRPDEALNRTAVTLDILNVATLVVCTPARNNAPAKFKKFTGIRIRIGPRSGALPSNLKHGLNRSVRALYRFLNRVAYLRHYQPE
jgi:hypothetical protein